MDSIDSSDSCSSTEAQLIIMTSNKKNIKTKVLGELIRYFVWGTRPHAATFNQSKVIEY